MKRKTWTLLTLFCVVLFLIAFTFFPAAATKTYRAEHFDVHVAVQPGGDLLVTENIDFKFEGGPFTFVFREIPFTKLDDILFLNASIDGRRLPLGNSASQIEVETTDPLKVVWHFSAISDASHVFTLNYRVRGAVRKGDTDRIIWRAIPEEHDYTIASSEITLSFPDNVQPLEAPRLDRSYTSHVENGIIHLTTKDLDEDSSLVLSAQFPADSLSKSIPHWQVRETQQRDVFFSALPVCLICFSVTVLLGFLWIWIYAQHNRRDLAPAPGYSGTSLPAELPPALAGKFTGKGISFVATFLDLARRGIVEFQEETDRHGKMSYILERKDPVASLYPHEELLFETLFPNGSREARLTDIAAPLIGLAVRFEKVLLKEMIERGWMDAQRIVEKTRMEIFFSILLMVTILVSVIVPVVGSFLIKDPSTIPLLLSVAGISLGGLVVSIAGILFSGNFSPFTPTGEEQAALWKGFRDYLERISRAKEAPLRPDFFEIYFPYAAVFNLSSLWMKNLEKSGTVPSMTWLRGLNNDTGDFGAFLTAASLWSSSGDSSSDGGGGGGASGGGSSGAG